MGLKANADGSGAIQVGGSDAITITSGLNTTFAGTAAVPTGTLYPIVSGTVTPSSGTALTYTSIPSWVKRITIMIASLQTSGAGVPIIQLSAASTFKTTGYLGAAGVTAASSAGASSFTTGFGLSNASWSSAIVIHGTVTFNLLNSSTNLWAVSGVLARSDSTIVCYTGGSVTLAGTLDGIRLYIDGTQTFTAGSINILYE
jgi:hypothetical protein